ncbi:hypothetical protein F66182_816 [Fusarium sp. NRRL 66182]|nr:hypothetical protein F66182_816 [Fusarium sp. NRRL 66182]
MSAVRKQDYVKDLGIKDPDGLFTDFLIDVQMGTQLRMSRIKKAISAVQLFAQRCLLGPENGIQNTSLVREQWQWRQQYSLWEAHIKMFLYPEKWLEPSLRDDKSQLLDDVSTLATYIANTEEGFQTAFFWSQAL